MFMFICLCMYTGKSPAFVYANIGKAVDDISPTTSNEEGAIDRAHSTANGSSTTITNHAMDSSSSSSTSTNLPTYSHNQSVVFPHGNGNSITMGGSSSGMFNGWPDGISYVPMGSSGPISGLTQRLFHGSMDSSTSVPGGFYIPYGLVHGSMMSASTDSATSAYSSGSSSAAALAAALAAGVSSSGYPGGFYHFGSSSDSLQAPSGSTDSSGSASSSSSLGLLNMFALMTSQSMDSLDVNGTDPFANLKLSLSSQSQEIINGSSTSSGIDGTSDFNHHDDNSSSGNSNSNSNTVPADVSSSITSGIVADPSTVNSSSGVLAVNPTDKVDGNTITTVEIKSNNRKTRKRKSTTSPPAEIEAEGEGEGESPSSSSTSSPHDDVSSTGKKSVSKQRSRSKSQQQQQQQQESVISQSTEQVEVDHHKQQQTSLRKKK